MLDVNLDDVSAIGSDSADKKEAPFPKPELLGTYFLTALVRFGRPVYQRSSEGRFSGFSFLYFYRDQWRAQWIVSDTLGQKFGWVYVEDPTARPQDITGTWFAAQADSWLKEDSLHVRCAGELGPGAALFAAGAAGAAGAAANAMANAAGAGSEMGAAGAAAGVSQVLISE